MFYWLSQEHFIHAYQYSPSRNTLLFTPEQDKELTCGIVFSDILQKLGVPFTVSDYAE